MRARYISKLILYKRIKVHITQLPLKRNYIILNNKFLDEILDGLIENSGSIAKASKSTNIPKSVLGRYYRKENNRIRIDSLLKITNLLNISLDNTENNIIWIGANNSEGISNPKLPFNFNSREGARFLAAICNDGCITIGFRKDKKFSYGRLMYNNNESSLRKSVIKDAESIFGENICKEFHKRNEFFLAFSSIVRDIAEVITNFKGKKSENNPSIPSFILRDKELIYGWIEQTIADEGQIKYEPKNYRHEIIWRRSFNRTLKNYKLIEDETQMLNQTGISYDIKDIYIYIYILCCIINPTF